MLRLIPGRATMAVGGPAPAAVADWPWRREAPPPGAARRPASRLAPVAVLHGAGEARAVRERERAERATRPPAPAAAHCG